MGCDGGTIPKRNELVKTKKKPETKDKDAEMAARWRYCAIKQDILQKPIVSCRLGSLYSKESVIEALLDRSLFPNTVTHIKTSRDIKTLNITENPVYTTETGTSNDSLATKPAQFICPIMGLEMNGNYRFLYLWSCGCVFSERAFKEVTTKTKNCPKCQLSYDDDDITILNPTSEELEEIKDNLETIKKLSRKRKKTN